MELWDGLGSRQPQIAGGEEYSEGERSVLEVEER